MNTSKNSDLSNELLDYKKSKHTENQIKKITQKKKKEIAKETKQIKLHFNLSKSDPLKKSQDKEYGANVISTTKYSILSFLPKGLMVLFNKFANVYFLIISILTMTDFSPKNPYTQVGTFIVMIIVSLLKELYEDCKRHREDMETNNKPIIKLTEEGFSMAKWKDLRVGDIVKIFKDEEVPADILAIDACGNKSESSDLCYVDTKNLDGESNLKEKNIIKVFNKDDHIGGYIECDASNDCLYKWHGRIYPKGKDYLDCSLRNTILKGSSLRNTLYVIGIVIYVGHSTKIMKNGKPFRHKTSNLMDTMNFILMALFICLILLCLLFSIMDHIYIYFNIGNLNMYVNSHDLNFKTLIVSMLTFLVSFSHTIPISLYVTIGIVKLIQVIIINLDAKKFNLVNGKRKIVRNIDLVEELGQVDFLITDKTGTLTTNCLSLVKLADKNLNEVLLYDNEMKGLVDDLFIHSMGICNSVLVDQEGEFSASSCDELAIVEKLNSLGISLSRNDSRSVGLNVNHRDRDSRQMDESFSQYDYKVLQTIGFTPERRRMSRIIENNSTHLGNTRKGILLIIKGADSEILQRLSSQEDTNSIRNKVSLFSKEGLRTMVYAYKILDEEEFLAWDSSYESIRQAYQDSQSTSSSRDLESIENKIESDLQFLGIVGIEDKLQKVNHIIKL